ncbi:MAG TPA: fatty acid oxidation complex subunit alpha FadJ [Gemmatimonadaceae bacterium]|nr:fatty acid oxidation complex subunit alpha FadJ [Gemmatimonadaceae bacterium]
MSDLGDTLSLQLEDGIAIVTFDAPGPVNTLNSRLAGAFDALCTRLDTDDTIRAAVLLSGKSDTWIAGADIDELAAVVRAEEAETLSRTGQRMLDRLAALRLPVVAAIHGACLGGGLEVALACHWRVLTDHPKSTCALPEVQLGLLPGAGGTQRLPRLIGLQAALDLILTGRTVRPRKAKSLGLVDDVVHPAILRTVAVQRARELAEKRRARTPRASGAAELLLEDNPIGRAIVFRKARESVMAKTRGVYPAPLAALEVIAEGYAHGVSRGLDAEARAFGRLAVTPESRELVFLFYATTALKKETFGDAARPVRRLGIVGGGFMGAGIASVAVQHDLLVRVRDASADRITAMRRAVRDVLDERRRRKRLTRLEFDDALARVSGGTDLTGFRRSDLVIEAVFEDLAVKQAVLRDVEAIAPDAIFASNTSTIPIARIAEAATRPERVVGMHFFSPVPKMPLLEVIAAPSTSEETVATAVACGRALGKTVIVVRDGPGFFVNRVLAPYLNAAGALLDDGAAIEDVDDALVRWGFPVGPFTLLDEVGLDVAGKSGQVLADALGERLAASSALARLIESGRLGRKGGRGFYTYENGKRGEPDAGVYAFTATGTSRRAVARAEMQDRCVLPLLNEAVRCLEDQIIRAPRDGDVGAVFGIGFPPFRGGPFRVIDAIGAAALVRQLTALDARFPGRYTPATRLREMAERGERFYPATGKPL